MDIFYYLSFIINVSSIKYLTYIDIHIKNIVYFGFSFNIDS